MKGFEVFSTTADVGLRIRGKSYSELYVNAVKGFFQLVTGREADTESGRVEYFHHFEFRGDSCENVLVNLLTEIVYLIDSRQYIASGISLKKAGASMLQADLALRPLLARPETEIKSVTYHNLRIRDHGQTKTVEIVFDI